jgi:hypothetical protein
MSFESVYRSKNGATELTKVANMIGSLVIKNEYEAQVNETSESLSNYIEYHGAYTRTDSFADYDLDARRKYKEYVCEYMQTLKRDYVFSIGLVNTLTEHKTTVLQEKYNHKQTEVIDYLNALRISRVFLYTEKNPYYRQFLGKPEPNDEKIIIQNFDVGDNGYIKIDNFDIPPMEGITYYKRNPHKYDDEMYVSIGTLTSWYVEDSEGNMNLVADEIFYIGTIFIDELKKSLYPKTYNYFILQKHINEIIEKYPTKYYLRFIGKEFTPFYIRKLPNYSVIQYDSSILSSVEQSYFFKSYEKAKKQVVMDYIKGFDSRQPLYNLLMIENLLYYTVINYSASYIERYSLGIYTEENCNDILESYGYSSLKTISNLDLKQRIVRNINELTSSKGSNYILDIIMNKILQDPNSELKRFYLEKQFTTAATSDTIEFNTAAGLEKSVKLILREVPALNINQQSQSIDSYHDYDQFVSNDDLWGGIDENDSTTTKMTKKEYLKKKILSSDFNSILTKYITLTRSVDILESQSQLRDMIYLMLKWFDDNESVAFFKTKVDFENFSATPATLFAMLCWLQQMKFYSDADTIMYDNCVINSSVVFRKMGLVGVDKNQLENNTYIIDGKPIVIYDISPEIMSWKVLDFIKENPDIIDSDVASESSKEFLRMLIENDIHIPTSILTDRYDENGNIIEKGILQYGKIKDDIKYLELTTENIEDYLTRFRFFKNGIDLGEITANTTFADLITDYKNQYSNLIKRITLKLQQSYDYREFQAWSYMLEQSRTDNSIKFIFKNYDTFSDYIKSFESDSLIDYVFSKLNKYIPTVTPTYSNGSESISIENYIKLHNTEYRMSDICSLQEELSSLFKEWVSSSFSDLVYSSDESDSQSASYISDMKLLFDEFLSVFSQLYSVDYNYSFGDKTYDGLFLQLFYNPISICMSDSYKDHMELTYDVKTHFYDKCSFDISLVDKIESYSYNKLFDNINGDIIYDNSTIQFISVNTKDKEPDPRQEYYIYDNDTDNYLGPYVNMKQFDLNKKYFIKNESQGEIQEIEDQFGYETKTIKLKQSTNDYLGMNDKFINCHLKNLIQDSIKLKGILKITSDSGVKTYYEKDS